jgi:hypothetical protein
MACNTNLYERLKDTTQFVSCRMLCLKLFTHGQYVLPKICIIVDSKQESRRVRKYLTRAFSNVTTIFE